MKLYFGFKGAELKCNEIQRNSYYCMALKYIVHFHYKFKHQTAPVLFLVLFI